MAQSAHQRERAKKIDHPAAQGVGYHCNIYWTHINQTGKVLT
jgi:hypothetical protein